MNDYSMGACVEGECDTSDKTSVPQMGRQSVDTHFLQQPHMNQRVHDRQMK